MGERIPGGRLTVVIRDENPVFYGANCNYRSVQIELNEKQRRALGMSDGECIDKVFIESERGR